METPLSKRAVLTIVLTCISLTGPLIERATGSKWLSLIPSVAVDFFERSTSVRNVPVADPATPTRIDALETRLDLLEKMKGTDALNVERIRDEDLPDPPRQLSSDILN